jgi:FKBP-type peptidyl-prolyl cis-trans isomerase SlyD
MQITDNAVVSIHYTLTNDAGETLDSSAGGEALTYLHGQGNIIPGLEAALLGKQVGDKLKVRIEPERGYGVRDPALTQEVPRSAFRGVDDIEVGMQFQAHAEHGPQTVVVTNVTADTVTVDANHPLAGEYLTFDVEIASVRAATKEELSHGHVHGPGGHHHHG